MFGSTLGTFITVTTFGESHGPAIGCLIDGCPPGTQRPVTQRREHDTIKILSGVSGSKSTGAPIALLIRNVDQRSKDCAKIASSFRPAHDYTYLRGTQHR